MLFLDVNHETVLIHAYTTLNIVESSRPVNIKVSISNQFAILDCMCAISLS